MTSDVPAIPRGAGAMLRAAREAKGLHIAALAAAIKVAPAKLDALEHDRYADLPGATFTRALAQTVCRHLKIDASAVLDLLPVVEQDGLVKVHTGLNQPFRERPHLSDSEDSGWLGHPMMLAAALALAAAALLYFVPMSTWRSWWPASSAAAVKPAAASASESTMAAVPMTSAAASVAVPAWADAASGESIAPVAGSAASLGASAPIPQAPSTASAVGTSALEVSAPSANALAVLRVSAPSWVEAEDATQAPLLRRLLQPGEVVGLEGKLPFRLKVGNVAATSITFKGAPVDLAAVARNNVAQLELK